MAEKGQYVANFEYGRCPYAGQYIGNFEYGLCPGIGYKYFPVLKVKSLPEDGVEIEVSPADIFGQQNGTTPFERHYERNTIVQVTAPSEFSQLDFKKWVIQGEEFTERKINIILNIDKTATVYYEAALAIIEKGVQMLKTRLLKNRFRMEDYPNLDPRLEGVAMPIAWGRVKGAPLFCIDTNQMVFKIIDNRDRPIKSVDAVYEKDVQLTEGVDYEVNLNEATITFFPTPKLEGGKTYYFTIESDFPIDGINYLRFAQKPLEGENDFERYDISSSGEWTTSWWKLAFRLYGKRNLNQDEQILFDTWSGNWEGWNRECKLRQSSGNIKIGQRFMIEGNETWNLTKIIICDVAKEGNPPENRITRIEILDENKNPIGAKSFRLEDYTPENGDAIFVFPQRSEISELRCDFQSVKRPDGNLIENVADIIEDCYVNILGGSRNALDEEALNELRLNRIENLAVYVNEEITLMEFLERLEVSQRFKFLPSLGQAFTVIISKPLSEWPDNIPHFRDEDFVKESFKCYKLWRGVYHRFKVKYNKNLLTSEWSIIEKIENISKAIYRNERTLEIETYFSSQRDAEACADAYKLSLRQPLLIIEFQVKGGKGFNLIPWQPIYISRKRGISETGKFEKKAFRILEIQKNPLEGICNIKAIENEATI